MNNNEIGKRLRKLRTSKNLTLDEMFEGIQEKICEYNGENYVKKDYRNGSYISSLESGTGNLQLEKAIGYSKFFDVSIDYLVFGTKSYKPEYDDIKKMLGLSDDALHNLEKLNKTNKQALNTLNKLLSPKLFPIFEELINDYSEHSLLDIKSHMMNYPGTVRYNKTAVSPLFLKYIDLDSKGLDTLSKTIISDCSKKLADEIRKSGDTK